MQEEYEILREGSRTYLRHEIKEARDVDLPDMEKLKIRGLIPGSRRFRDGKEYILYDISGKHSMRDIYDSGSMGFESMRSFLESLDGIKRQLYEYLLSEENLLLDPDRIYLSSDLSEFFYIYEEENLSTRERSEFFSMNLRGLSEFLIMHALHEDENAVTLAYRFFSDASCDCMNIEEILRMPVKHRGPQEEVKESDTIEEKESKEKGFLRLKKRDEKEHKEKTAVKSLGVILPIVPALLLIGAAVSFQEKRNIILSVLITYLAGYVIYLLGRRKKPEKSAEKGQSLPN